MKQSNDAMVMAGKVLRGMADAAKGTKPETVEAALRQPAVDFAYAISGSKMARTAAAAKQAARGTGRIVVPSVLKSAGRNSTIR